MDGERSLQRVLVEREAEIRSLQEDKAALMSMDDGTSVAAYLESLKPVHTQAFERPDICCHVFGPV